MRPSDPVTHSSAAPLVGAAVEALQTPALLVDRRRFEENLARMRRHLAAWPEVKLRPHLKTTKSPAAAERVSPDRGPITVSTLKEAEEFAARGFRDIVYAVGLAPDKLGRVATLNRKGVRTTVILDNLEAAQRVAEFCRAEGVGIPVLIEVDTDGQRGGVPPDAQLVVEIGETLAASGLLEGALTHAGGSYSARSKEDLARFAETERAGAVHAAEKLREAGLPCPVVSIGSTPTVLFTRDLTGVTEVRAGVYVFQDLVMAGVGVCSVDEIALSVLTSVIGHRPDRGQIVVDAGWMALSRDRGSQNQAVDQGYGLVTDLEGRPVEDLVVLATNQEHGLVGRRSGEPLDVSRFRVGDKLRILPNHACATAAQHERYLVVGPGFVEDVWPRFNHWA